MTRTRVTPEATQSLIELLRCVHRATAYKTKDAEGRRANAFNAVAAARGLLAWLNRGHNPDLRLALETVLREL